MGLRFELDDSGTHVDLWYAKQDPVARRLLDDHVGDGLRLASRISGNVEIAGSRGAGRFQICGTAECNSTLRIGGRSF